jgi:hypothetical protein
MPRPGATSWQQRWQRYASSTFGASFVVADTQGPTALCLGDLELPAVQFHCQRVSVELVADADINDVIARSAPIATVIGLTETAT